MNFWMDEKTAEYNRKRLLDEAEHFRLENIAMKSRVYRPRFFARSMYGFANWMISTGKDLRKRYEIPAAKCNNPSKESFAH